MAVTLVLAGMSMLANAGYGDFVMTTIARKLTGFSFLARQRTVGEADLNALSDRCLKDIGFRLDRRDLSSVKPFWLA
jgi:uncharacterized protein YjiS (DUF1127 family)